MGEGGERLIGTCHCGGAHWTLSGDPGPVTACNCTLCRRYVALWAYDFENERVALNGTTTAFPRHDRKKPVLETHFCPTCGCLLCWRDLTTTADGRRRMAVNIRLAPPEAVAHLPVHHFDGLASFKTVPRNACVEEMWF
ncbi:MAG: GFA family protein [Bosea sp.]|nr:GFA family protein [Bosea sp. (in: a-proteobacteria)]